ncbi:MAG: chromate resistance protein, partial [Acidobacteria bacterium]
QAEFLFVPRDRVAEVARAEGATSYDCDGDELGHRGPECSFDAIVRKYGLDGDQALVLLARIVNGADTDNALWHQPESAGLQAIAEGFRHLGFADDMRQNEAEWIVYDALYAYCQEMVKRGKPAGNFVL